MQRRCGYGLELLRLAFPRHASDRVHAAANHRHRRAAPYASSFLEARVMCTCHADIDTKLEPLNGKLATGFQLVRDEREMVLTLLMQVEKINPRGKKPPHVLPTYCPFCGDKLNVAKAEAA
jgi:hypothetical protein